MSASSSMLYLLGAVAGYAAMMAFQPHRKELGEAYRTVRDFPCLWLVVGVFESVRLTLALVVAIASDEVTPGQFISAGPWNEIPLVGELLRPALREAAGGLLRIATRPVDVRPVSALLAIALLANAGGGLRRLWGHKDLGRRMFAFLATVTAGMHLAWYAGGWISREPGAVPVLNTWIFEAGGRLFEVGAAVAVQAWLVLWFIGARRREFLEVPVTDALERTRTLVLLIFVYWFAGEAVREAGIEIPGAAGLPVLAVLALWVMPAQIRAIGGEAGLPASLRKHGLWIAAHPARTFWWLAVAGVHLVMLALCGLGMGEAVGEVPWARWIWGVFFAFLKAGVIVWLLGAFVLLVEESLRPTRRSTKRRRSKKKPAR